ncbi:MAG: type IV secretion system protein VirB10 [Ideonella sp.]|nr:type IV secretion system protein VirB10 [Ideonella sp.]
MNDRIEPGDLDRLEGELPDGNGQAANTITPLPGEAGIPSVAQPRTITVSRKGLLAAGLLIASLVAVAVLSLQRFATSGKKVDDGEPKRVSDRPAAAAAEPRKLDLPPILVAATARPSGASAPTPRIPALVPTTQEVKDAEAIAVRRTGANASGAKPPSPQDAPVMVVSTRPPVLAPAGLAARHTEPIAAQTNHGGDAQPPNDSNDPLSATARNLDAYQRQLQGLLDTLTRTAALATKQAVAEPDGVPPISLPSRSLITAVTGAPSTASTASSQGLFGGQLQGSATPRVLASNLGNRSLTLPKGAAFTCALKTKVISAASGLVGCQVLRNVYSDDGRVLLIERGSHMDGEYRTASVRPGTVRIPVLWTRIRTPHGVTVDIDSPGTGQLGESGIDGYVDNRWGERIGAALLLSLIDDAAKLTIQGQANDRQAETVVLQSTADTTNHLAEKVLDSTINIPPLSYQNQGGIVGIYVARDVDFSPVYELRRSALPASSATR